VNPELGGNALPRALMHPIAWNRYSPKFAVAISLGPRA
jgi:hypothetical protein